MRKTLKARRCLVIVVACLLCTLLPVYAQTLDILMGTSLASGVDIGVNSSTGRTEWLSQQDGFLRMSYGPNQAWGAVFVTVGLPTDFNRPSWDLSAHKLLSVEMRGLAGGETIDIGIKTNTQPDNGSEAKIRVALSNDWRTYNFSLDRFVGTDTSRLYVLIEFVFDGPVAETVDVRAVRYFPVDDTKQAYSIADRGAETLLADGSQLPYVSVGYARVQTDSGKLAPTGFAIFSYKQNELHVSEAAVPASPTTRSGRTYVEIGGRVNTGIAIANPNNMIATVNFFFTDSVGTDIGSGVLVVPPNGQVARFLNEAPFYGPPIRGSFTFSSSLPVSVVSLRGYANERGEFLISTLPSVSLGSALATPVVLPHYADGGGWMTEILLLNPTNSALSGSVQFFDRSGGSTNVNIGGQTASSFPYTVPRRSSVRLATRGQGVSTVSGAVRVSPTVGVAPVPLVVFSYTLGGVIVTETGVSATQSGAAFRVFVEGNGRLERGGEVQTGLAIANAGINLQLL